VQERMAEYVLSTDIPLQLVKEEHRLLDEIAKLVQQLAVEVTMKNPIGPSISPEPTNFLPPVR
jgi:hypothetical protein